MSKVKIPRIQINSHQIFAWLDNADRNEKIHILTSKRFPNRIQKTH